MHVEVERLLRSGEHDELLADELACACAEKLFELEGRETPNDDKLARLLERNGSEVRDALVRLNAAQIAFYYVPTAGSQSFAGWRLRTPGAYFFLGALKAQRAGWRPTREPRGRLSSLSD